MKIIFFLILILLFGLGLSIIFDRIKLIEFKNLNYYEKVTYIITLSILSTSIIWFLIGILDITYNKYIFVFFGIFDLITIILMFLKLSKKEKQPDKKIKIKISKKDVVLNILFSIVFLVIILYLLSLALKNNYIYPDEFSAWGLNAKSIFLAKNLYSFIISGLQGYINLIPVFFSMFFTYCGEIMENISRTISPIMYLLLTLGMIGIGKKHNIKPWQILLFNSFIAIVYTEFFSFGSSIYADITLTCFYTLGILYFCEWMHDKKSLTSLALFIIYMNGACFSKKEIIYLVFGSFFLIFLIDYIINIIRKSKKFPLKKYIIILFLIILTGLLNFLLLKYNNEPTINHSTFNGGNNIIYIIKILSSMFSQLFSSLPWLIFIIISIVYIFFNYQNLSSINKKIVLYSCYFIIINFCFLFACYIFIFGAGEAVIAASFIRYIIRVLFIYEFATLLLINTKKSQNE